MCRRNTSGDCRDRISGCTVFVTSPCTEPTCTELAGQVKTTPLDPFLLAPVPNNGVSSRWFVTNKCGCHEQSSKLARVGRGKVIWSVLLPDHIDCLHTMLQTIVRMLHFVFRQTLKVFFTLHAYTVADCVYLSSNLN